MLDLYLKTFTGKFKKRNAIKEKGQPIDQDKRSAVTSHIGGTNPVCHPGLPPQTQNSVWAWKP
jgi:hypothetical protein